MGTFLEQFPTKINVFIWFACFISVVVLAIGLMILILGLEFWRISITPAVQGELLTSFTQTMVIVSGFLSIVLTFMPLLSFEMNCQKLQNNTSSEYIAVSGQQG